MLEPVEKIFLDTKPGRVGFLSTSPPSSSHHFAKDFIFAQLSSYLKIPNNFFSACPVHVFLMLQAHLKCPKHAGVSTKHKVEPQGKKAQVSNVD